MSRMTKLLAAVVVVICSSMQRACSAVHQQSITSQAPYADIDNPGSPHVAMRDEPRDSAADHQREYARSWHWMCTRLPLGGMMATASLRDHLVDELKDLLNAEQQLLE